LELKSKYVSPVLREAIFVGIDPKSLLVFRSIRLRGEAVLPKMAGMVPVTAALALIFTIDNETNLFDKQVPLVGCKTKAVLAVHSFAAQVHVLNSVPKLVDVIIAQRGESAAIASPISTLRSDNNTNNNREMCITIFFQHYKSGLNNALHSALLYAYRSRRSRKLLIDRNFRKFVRADLRSQHQFNGKAVLIYL
jgi:hypothetical protein